MRNIILLLFVTLSFTCLSQDTFDSDKIEVKKVVNQFFESLNKQDTILYKKIVFLEGQIWSINRMSDTNNIAMRFFCDDIDTFNLDEIWEEIPLSFEIKIYNGIAMAWVPYEFKVNGEFTHCGIDIFTLTETVEGWKIINASYTKYSDGCNDLKN